MIFFVCYKNSNKKYIGWFFVALLQFGVVGALKHNSYGFLILSTIGLTYWYGFRWRIREYFIKKTFDKSQLANKQIELLATDDSIVSHDGNEQIPYSDIKEYKRIDDAIIIYHKIGTLYIPNSSFISYDEKEAFIQKL